MPQRKSPDVPLPAEQRARRCWRNSGRLHSVLSVSSYSDRGLEHNRGLHLHRLRYLPVRTVGLAFELVTDPTNSWQQQSNRVASPYNTYFRPDPRSYHDGHGSHNPANALKLSRRWRSAALNKLEFQTLLFVSTTAAKNKLRGLAAIEHKPEAWGADFVPLIENIRKVAVVGEYVPATGYEFFKQLRVLPNLQRVVLAPIKPGAYFHIEDLLTRNTADSFVGHLLGYLPADFHLYCNYKEADYVVEDLRGKVFWDETIILQAKLDGKPTSAEFHVAFWIRFKAYLYGRVKQWMAKQA